MDTTAFVGVFLGAALGAIFGGRLQMVENQRLEARHRAQEKLREASQGWVQLLNQAIEVERPDQLIIRKEAARLVGFQTLKGAVLDRDEQVGFQKACDAAVRGVQSVYDARPDPQAVLAAMKTATDDIDDGLDVVWRGVDEATRVDWRTLVTHFFTGYPD